MKVFISWSGEKSRDIAEIISEWLPVVINAVKPYFSPEDVPKGSLWFSNLAKELDASSVGLLCLLPDNLNSEWLLFEAGALAKKFDESKVCPLLFGVGSADLSGPLTHFQAAPFQKAEFRRVMVMINRELKDDALAGDILDKAFDKWWPDLEEQVNQKLNESDQVAKKEPRVEREILEEILGLNRALTRDIRSGAHCGIALDTGSGLHGEPNREVIENLASAYVSMLMTAAKISVPSQIYQMLWVMYEDIEHILLWTIRVLGDSQRSQGILIHMERQRSLMKLRAASSRNEDEGDG